eukprot:8715220-Alexandrium_andersonii.AAC.1
MRLPFTIPQVATPLVVDDTLVEGASIASRMQRSHTVVRALNAHARAQAVQHDTCAESRESARVLNVLQLRQEHEPADTRSASEHLQPRAFCC